MPDEQFPADPGTQFTRAHTEEQRAIVDEPPGSPITFTASTPGAKRDGLDLRASGWRVDNFMRNPVVLWAHGHHAPPIGRAGASVESTRLRMPVSFDQEDPFAVRIESKYRRGFLHAVSVGWDFVDADGQRIPWWRLDPDGIRDDAFYDLTELSAVPVPADPDALADRQRAALRHISRELEDLFNEQERSDSRATAPEVHEAVLAECKRLGIPLDLDHWAPIGRSAANAANDPAAHAPHIEEPPAGSDSGWLREADLPDALTRLGWTIPASAEPEPTNDPPAPAGVAEEAARSVLAAFDTFEGKGS